LTTLNYSIQLNQLAQWILNFSLTFVIRVKWLVETYVKGWTQDHFNKKNYKEGKKYCRSD